MVVPIRKVANRQFSLFLAISYHSIIAQFPSNTKIDVISGSVIKKRSNFSSKASSRSSSVFSSISSGLYHEYMEVDNNKSEEDIK